MFEEEEGNEKLYRKKKTQITTINFVLVITSANSKVGQKVLKVIDTSNFEIPRQR